jgi:hypothetical protein
MATDSRNATFCIYPQKKKVRGIVSEDLEDYMKQGLPRSFNQETY